MHRRGFRIFIQRGSIFSRPTLRPSHPFSESSGVTSHRGHLPSLRVSNTEHHLAERSEFRNSFLYRKRVFWWHSWGCKKKLLVADFLASASNCFCSLSLFLSLLVLYPGCNMSTLVGLAWKYTFVEREEREREKMRKS